MQRPIAYTRNERVWLATLGVFGFVAVNGAFAYGLVCQPDALTSALTNPVAAAFIIEALVLVGVFAYLFERWGGESAGHRLVRVSVVAGKHGLRHPRRAAVSQAGRGMPRTTAGKSIHRSSEKNSIALHHRLIQIPATGGISGAAT